MVAPEKILLLFSDDKQAMYWEQALIDVGFENFCLAFDSKQAFALLQQFGDIKAVIGAENLLNRATAEESDKQLFTALDARVVQTLLLQVSKQTRKTQVREQVLTHVRSQRSKKRRKVELDQG